MIVNLRDTQHVFLPISQLWPFINSRTVVLAHYQHSRMDVHDLVLKDGDVRAVENKLEGIKIIRDFLTKKEEQTLINSVDGSPWNEEIKRRTQQYGAKYDYRYITLFLSIVIMNIK